MDTALAQFERLFNQYSDAIFRHLQYRLGDRERAKELTQEVFMRTWQHLASGKRVEYEKAFLYKIANNLFINEIRTDKTNSSLDHLEEVHGVEVTSILSSPQKIAEEQELQTFIQSLPPPYRDVLIYRYIDDMTVKDIAKLLGEKETNISMRLKRATEKLKQTYNLTPYESET
jgi:RNA polymerase sigma-70 factor (ECF subfamily)